jgi:hypothetical protein
MKWTPWLFGSVAAALIAGCGGERGNDDTGATGGAETETGTMQGGTGATRDTSQSDTVRRNPDSTTAGSTQ